MKAPSCLDRVFDALVSTDPGVEDKECVGVVVSETKEEMRRKKLIGKKRHRLRVYCTYSNKRARTSFLSSPDQTEF
jgi:hypothetical protein